MKYAAIILAGAADFPLESLGGNTALASANLPAINQVAASGVVGQAYLSPVGLPIGDDIPLMSLLGLDPNHARSGQASLQALGQDLSLSEDQCVVCCDLVTVTEGRMVDPTAGYISDDEARELLDFANEKLGRSDVQFVAGQGHRNLLLAPKALVGDMRLTSPNDLRGRSILDAFPRGAHSEVLCQMMDNSAEWFADHPVNQRRRQQGLPEASCIWFWAVGQRLENASFEEQFGKLGCLVANDYLALGLAKQRELGRVQVGRSADSMALLLEELGAAAVNAIADSDVVFVYVKTADEAGLKKDARAKVEALQALDSAVVAPIVAQLKQHSEWRLLICPDKVCSAADGKQHVSPVCFAAAGTGIAPDDFQELQESNAERSGLQFKDGIQLLPWFLGH